MSHSVERIEAGTNPEGKKIKSTRKQESKLLCLEDNLSPDVHGQALAPPLYSIHGSSARFTGQ